MKLTKVVMVALGVLVGAQSAYADPWKIEVAPYLWAINMNGRVQVGPATAHVNENFSDILSQFHGGGMLYLDAQKDRFGIFFNAMYAVLEQSTHFRQIKISSRNNFGLFAGGVSYSLYQKQLSQPGSMIAIEPYLGARYTLNDVTVKVGRFSATNDKHWTDPILGAKVRYDMNAHWQGILAGDVGGTSMSRDKSYNVQGFIGYKPTSMQHTTFYLGYRMLYQHYVTGNGLKRFDWTMKLFGPVLGASIIF